MNSSNYFERTGQTSFNADQRLQALRDAAYTTETASFDYQFTAEETQEMREDYFRALDSERIIKTELEALKKDYEAKLKKIDSQKIALHQFIKTGIKTMQGEVFLLDNQETGMMEIFDRDGNLVRTRPLKPSERQAHLFRAGELRLSANE